ncbi:uncharacterized protein LOC139922388 [Centroberyx gerrardi]|uniref:uncharacterized protein n=1 Tax=Centroberyx gerrardi TaxID=166262 RepID=UPI003AAA4E40
MMTSVYRDMFALCATVLLYFISVSHSAPLSCEDLLRPLDQLEPGPMEGRWTLVASSLNHLPSLESLKRVDSITIDISVSVSNSNETSSYTYTQITRFGNKCEYFPFNISIEGSTLTFNVRDNANFTGTFLHTSCPDCVVMRLEIEELRINKSLDLYLFSRRREVGPKEMEEYKAQLECLELPPPVVMDPTKELCPEQTPSEPAAAPTGEKTEEQTA